MTPKNTHIYTHTITYSHTYTRLFSVISFQVINFSSFRKALKFYLFIIVSDISRHKQNIYFAHGNINHACNIDYADEIYFLFFFFSNC